MPYDEFLTDRIRRVFKDQNAAFEEKKMMARIDPEIQDQALSMKGCVEMDFTHFFQTLRNIFFR